MFRPPHLSGWVMCGVSLISAEEDGPAAWDTESAIPALSAIQEKEQLQATVHQLEAEALDRSVARDQDNDRAALQEEVEQLQVENQVSALCSAACPLKGTAP